PVVPVYQGRFNIVSPEVVLADIANQVAAGAEHITFGDPDFFNGPAHAVRVVEAMKEAFPTLTYDATIKIEHLADRLDLITWLGDTGCAFVTTAMESFDNRVLEILEKGHTVDDFVRVLDESRRVGLPIAPTFVAFTPWTTLESYGEFLGYVDDLGLVESVAPIQYGIRLLLPAGSLLLEVPEVADLVEPFDAGSLTYPWQHPDPDVDRLQEAVMSVVGHDHESNRRVIFDRVWAVATEFGATTSAHRDAEAKVPALATIPYMTEPWYC
ncbi:MAG: radical SAM protein, partial [Acidimicrobiia bacterium]